MENTVLVAALAATAIIGFAAIGALELVFRFNLKAIKSAKGCVEPFAEQREHLRSELRRAFARSHGITLSTGASYQDLVKALEDKGVITNPLTHKRD